MRLRPEAPFSLAALRIAVPTLILLGPELREGVRVASLDPRLWVAPEGLGAFVRWAPAGPRVALAAELVAAFAALCAIVGVRARPALAVLTLSAGYLFAFADLTGWVWKDMHLLWFAALLSVSPCDRALTIDRVGTGEAPSTAYAWPLLFARLLLGAVYFFPGAHKLARSGLAWALSDNLQNQLYWKWLEHGAVPSFRVDAYPALLQAGALFVLLFELAAPVLFVLRRTRLVAAVSGVAFHLVAQEVLRIPFLSLWGCYVVLLDLGPLVAWVQRRRKRHPPEEPAATSARPLPVLVVGGALLIGACVQGIRGQTQAFPFACYPTFEYRAGTTLPDLRVVAVMPDGREVEVPHARDANGYRTQREWATISSLVGAGGVSPASETARDQRLVAYYAAAAGDATRDAIRVRFFVDHRSVLPEDRDAKPVRERLLADVLLSDR